MADWKNIPVICAFASILMQVDLYCSDWNQYRGPDYNSISREIGVSTNWNEKSIKTLWRVELHGGFSSFSVRGNRVFTLDKWIEDGVPKEFCIALDADTGKQLWAKEMGIARYDYAYDAAPYDGPRSTPTVVDGKVYALSAHLSLYCLDEKDGKAIWSKDLIKEFGAQNIGWQNAASPIVENGVVILNCGAKGQSFLGLNKDTGEIKWKNGDFGLTHSTPSVATIHGVKQAVFMTQQAVVSISPENGKILWQHNFPRSVSIASSPVVANDIVYCTAGYGVGAYAFKVTKNADSWTVRELWRKVGNKHCNQWSTPVYVNGFLYGIFGFKQYKTAPLKCLEIGTGNERWVQDGFGMGNLIYVNGFFIVLSDQGDVYLVEANPREYREIGKVKGPSGNCWSTPAYSNGRLYLRSHKEGICLIVSEQK
ncbi:MAG: PQQ-like beta-propeller repeat protein [Verrucomicrobiae bacterium]|nr:PQQ-like beta-propeller repeat protein [Verrucomicrobiae bacterium]